MRFKKKFYSLKVNGEHSSKQSSVDNLKKEERKSRNRLEKSFKILKIIISKILIGAYLNLLSYFWVFFHQAR